MKAIGNYVLWMLPAVAMAIASVYAIGRWGAPVSAEFDTTLAGIEFGDGDPAPTAATMDRQGLPIAIEIDPETFSLMCRMDNREIYKDRAVNATVRFGDTGEVGRYGVVTLRGRGSLLKSSAMPNYDVKLIRPVQFADGIELDRLFLMNLYYDKHQMEIPVAYRLLAELGLFPLHFQFVRLTVAGKPHGMYLLVEPPVSGLRRAHPDCVSVFRRSRPNGYDVEWTAPVPGVRTSLKRLRTIVDDRSADNRAADLATALDQSSYFRWLGVNALLRNADSLDELFLYERRSAGASNAPLQVLGWDYDDIISSELKPGALSDPLLYGSLDPLEKSVAADPELYLSYRRFLSQALVGELSLERVEQIVLDAQSLRDRLDDGSDQGDQRRARKKRAAYVEGMLATLRETHRMLGQLSADPPTSTAR